MWCALCFLIFLCVAANGSLEIHVSVPGGSVVLHTNGVHSGGLESETDNSSPGPENPFSSVLLKGISRGVVRLDKATQYLAFEGICLLFTISTADVLIQVLSAKSSHDLYWHLAATLSGDQQPHGLLVDVKDLDNYVEPSRSQLQWRCTATPPSSGWQDKNFQAADWYASLWIRIKFCQAFGKISRE